MTALNDKAIIKMFEKGDLKIDPFTPDNVQLGSIDLTLWNYIDVFDSIEEIDILNITKDRLNLEKETIEITEGYSLKPGEFITGYSKEVITLPHYVNGIIANRNSLAKIGLNANISNYINPGFHGRKIIVIQNISKRIIKIHPGVRICQLVLFKMEGESLRTFNKRHDQEDILSFIKTLNIKNQSLVLKNHPDIDNSLSEFMNEQIRKIAESK